MRELLYRSLWEHRDALERGEYSSLELTLAHLDRIGEIDGEIGAFLAVDADGALCRAQESDARRRRGASRGPLDGIPFAVKDNFCTKNLPTTCASRMLEGFAPPYDADAVRRLHEAGALLLGKLNMDEFAIGSTNESSSSHTTKNPVDLSRVAGGSSGGSAAAVAAGEAVFSLGSDTGGSVRCPASFCGVYGLRPTQGALSRRGLVALASSFDCVGVLSRTPRDAREIFSALAGRDPLDATSRDLPASRAAHTPLRVAIVEELFQGVVSDEVSGAVEKAEKAFRNGGAVTGRVSLPSPEEALAAYGVLVAAEASSNLARYDGIRYGQGGGREDLFSLYADARGKGFGEGVKKQILFGNWVLCGENRATLYEKAMGVRARVRKCMMQILSEWDLLLTPTTLTTAPPIGMERTPREAFLADLCTVYASLAGLPSLAVPFGRDRAGLPLSVQLTAAPFCEERLFLAAELLESIHQ